MSIASLDDEREYWGREVYLEIEERMLRTVVKRPTLSRWKSLCRIMSDGLSIAASELDREVLSRGWLCLGALHLETLPLLPKPKRKLPLHEYSVAEKCSMVDAFMPLAKSMVFYLNSVFPGFDAKTGKWSRAGHADKREQPFPFFIARWFNGSDGIDVKCEYCLFKTNVDDSAEPGLTFTSTYEFFRELATISDDNDASLWLTGTYAGNTSIQQIWQALADIDTMKRTKQWPPNKETNAKQFSPASRKVFVVHGHDEDLLASVKRFLQDRDLRPIVLRDEPNEGKTIIEKFEYYSHVDFAIVLLTADDVAHEKTQPDKQEKRGRQNVVFEMGYFIGKFGRSKIAVLCDPGVTRPGDVDGLVYISVDNGNWEQHLEQELQSADLLAPSP